MGKTRTMMRVPTDAILDSHEQDRLQHCVRTSMFSFREAVKDFEKVVEAGGTSFMTLRSAELMRDEFTRYADEAGELLERLEDSSRVVIQPAGWEYDED